MSNILNMFNNSRAGGSGALWRALAVFKNPVQVYAGILLALFDFFVLSGVFFLIVFLRMVFPGHVDLSYYLELAPFLSIAVIYNAASGLYPWPSIPQHQELQKTFEGISCALACILIVFSFFMKSQEYSRAIFFFAWVTGTPVAFMARGMMRKAMAKRFDFATPGILIGRRCADIFLERISRLRPSGGLKVVGLLSTTLPKGSVYRDIPVLGHPSEAASFAMRNPGCCAMVTDRRPSENSTTYLPNLHEYFYKVLILPSLGEYSRRWAETRDLGGVIGLELSHNLLDTRRRVFKRGIDVLLAGVGLVVTLPIMALVAIAISVDSRGPIFYRQNRIGFERRTIGIWKFRTMCSDADAVLKNCLENDPELRAEWMRDHKLRHDPRITKVGSFLRRSSLDELPQLWNVLCGEISMVGPRPIVREEIERYGRDFACYCKVRPGITGLWQVAGRNHTTYEERVQLDAYYVNNWSVWLDILILCRTIPVIVSGDGAY